MCGVNIDLIASKCHRNTLHDKINDFSMALFIGEEKLILFPLLIQFFFFYEWRHECGKIYFQSFQFSMKVYKNHSRTQTPHSTLPWIELLRVANKCSRHTNNNFHHLPHATVEAKKNWLFSNLFYFWSFLWNSYGILSLTKEVSLPFFPILPGKKYSLLRARAPRVDIAQETSCIHLVRAFSSITNSLTYWLHVTRLSAILLLFEYQRGKQQHGLLVAQNILLDFATV